MSKRARILASTLLVGVVVAGCAVADSGSGLGFAPGAGAGNGDGGNDAGGDEDDGAEPETDGEDGGSDGDGGDDGEDGEPDGLLFDVGWDGTSTGGPGDQEGNDEICKVDFLFVIDNSESMEDDQIRLINAFPEFIDGIKTVVKAEDYHIGVITTDAHVYDYDLYYGGGTPTECDVMGGLVTENWDYQTNSHRICAPFVGGANFLTQDEPDLSEKFECIAFVDDEGSTDEAPFAAITAALQRPAIPCNEGFLRDDALLVIVLITDEDDDYDGNPGSGGDPQTWYDAVVAAKNGIPENVAVLALAGTQECSYEHTVRIEEFVGMFGDNGFMGPVCQDNYGQFFADSVPVVDNACAGFQPPG